MRLMYERIRGENKSLKTIVKVLGIIVLVLAVGLFLMYEHHQEQQRTWYAELHQCEWGDHFNGADMVFDCR